VVPHIEAHLGYFISVSINLLDFAKITWHNDMFSLLPKPYALAFMGVLLSGTAVTKTYSLPT
jgi:hypothetical protein